MSVGQGAARPLSGTSLSDDRGPAQSGQAPDGTPLHRPARSARRAPALPEAAEPGLEGGPRGAAQQGEEQPHAEIDRDQRRGQVAAGEPDAVAGDHAVVDRVPRGRGRRVVQNHVGPVVDHPARVEGPPCQIGFLVGVEELVREAADFGEDLGACGVGAAEEGGDPGGAHRVGGPQPGDVPALGDPRVGVGDAEADDAEPRVGLEGLAAQFGGVVVREEAVVVEEEQDVDGAAAGPEGLDADVAAAGDAEVLRQLDRADAVGDVRDGRAVADDDHLDRVAVLLGDRVEQGAQLVGAVAHGDDHRADLHAGAHFSLLEARIDTRCSRVWSRAIPASTATPSREKNRSSRSWSAIARTRISSEASMPRISRWNLNAAAARRASAMPEVRISAAASWTGGFPVWWRATPTRSVSALIRMAPRAARVPRKAHSQSIRPLPNTSAARRPKPTSTAASVR